jgi:3-dehydrosphinganine reductase
MGRGVGKLLASKGANVIIVARDQKKLNEAIAYISVLTPYLWLTKTRPN